MKFLLLITVKPNPQLPGEVFRKTQGVGATAYSEQRGRSSLYFRRFFQRDVYRERRRPRAIERLYDVGSGGTVLRCGNPTLSRFCETNGPSGNRAQTREVKT